MFIALKCCPSVCGGEEREAEQSRAGDKENERDGQVPGGRIFSSVAQLQSGKWKTSCQCLLHRHFFLQCCFNAEQNKDDHTLFPPERHISNCKQHDGSVRWKVALVWNTSKLSKFFVQNSKASICRIFSSLKISKMDFFHFWKKLISRLLY